MRSYPFLLLLILLGSSAPASSQSPDVFNPQTILVSQFVFTLPQQWRWVDTKYDEPNIAQSLTLRVPAGTEGECSVFLNHFMPKRPAASRAAVATRWVQTFPSASESTTFGKSVSIGAGKLAYLELSGTYKPGKNAMARSKFSMCGALFEHPQGNLVIRLMGPTIDVDRARPAFKEMIERALENAW